MDLGDSSFLPLVRQLIKSQRVQNKLGVVFEKEKDRTQRKDFIFVSARVSCCLCQGVGGCWSLLRRSPTGIGGADLSFLAGSMLRVDSTC